MGTEARDDPAEKALDAAPVEDPPVFRFGFRGHPDAVVGAGVGVPPRDGGSAEGAEKGVDRLPGACLALPAEPVLDVRKKEVGQDRDEKVGHAAVGLLLEDGPDAEGAFEIPEDLFHSGQGRVEGPDVPARPVGVAGFDDVGAGEEVSLLPPHVPDPGEAGDPGFRENRRLLRFPALPGFLLSRLLRGGFCGDRDDGVEFCDR